MLFGYRKISSNNNINSSSTKTEFFKLLTILFAILALHAIAMVQFEKLHFWDAIWLTMTSATTVGYGDFSAKTAAGRISTIILLYLGGIAILTQVFAAYFEHKQEVKNKKITGHWNWNMKNHIVFINCPENLGEEYFYRAISGLRKSCSEISKLPIIIISEEFKNGLPHSLQKLNIVQVNKSISYDEALESANIKDAHTVVVLSKAHLDPISDSINFELVDRLRTMGIKARIIAEVVKDGNRDRLKKAGANNVLRPIRAYPELLIRAIIAPGSEQVIETIFDSYGEECVRYDLSIKCQWIDVIYKFAEEDIGVPIAYEDADGKIFNNPSSKTFVDAKALFVLVHEGYIQNHQMIEGVFSPNKPRPISFFKKIISKILNTVS